MNKIIFETKRLYVAAPSMGSLENRAKLLCNREVAKFLGNGMPKSRFEVQDFLTRNIEHYEKSGFCLFDVYLKEDNEFIGDAGLIYEALNSENKDVEVGYRLLPKFWGKGYATELAQAFISWGFDEFGFNRIVAFYKSENIASANVMKKCGMRYGGKHLYGGKKECEMYFIKS